MRRWVVLSTVCIVSCALLIIAAPVLGKPTPSSSRQQAPEALAQWGFLVGKWEMDSKRYSLDGPVIENNEGQATFSWGMQGLRLEERQTTKLAGRDMLVLNVFAFHPDKNEWEIARTDSIHHSFNVKRGTGDAEKIVLFEKNPRAGSDVTRRFTYHRHNADRFSLLLEFSLDSGETWLRRNETTYTRR